MKEKIILLAHGSSDPNWSNTFVNLTHPACSENAHVSLGFMELSTPTLEDCIADAKKEGYSKVSILPLFLATGRHLKKDVPAMLKEYETKYSISSTLLSPIGEHPRLADALCQIIEDSI